MLDHALGMALQRLAQGFGLEVADVAGEAEILLVGQLVAGDGHLLGVDHDDVVAGVHVRGVDGLVLATQAAGDLAAETAERLAGGVDHVPVTLYGLGLGAESLHEGNSFRWVVGLVAPAGAGGTSPRVVNAERKRRNDTGPPPVPQQLHHPLPTGLRRRASPAWWRGGCRGAKMAAPPPRPAPPCPPPAA